ncbi:MAG: hypothetical protein N3E39_00655 [Candidatus Methanomethylicia archaeon]|nr:hypothetical protein [Candidatus Methanomethylicia archaeon]
MSNPHITVAIILLIVGNLKSILSKYRDKITGDVIRVLSLGMGKLWLSELVLEINAFRRSLGFEEVDEEDVKNSIRVLEADGIITSESRLRSQLFGESVMDILISLVDYPSIVNELKNDERYNAYISKYRSLT